MDWSVIWQAVSSVFATWHDIKLALESVRAVSDDALHVIAGVVLQILFALVLRTSLASWRALLPVVTLLLFNEAVDLWAERWPSLTHQIAEGGKDLLLTLILPILITLVLRVSPGLGRRHRG